MAAEPRSTPTSAGAVLSLVDYRKALHLLEDMDDAKALRRAIRIRRGTITHAQLLKRLKHQSLNDHQKVVTMARIRHRRDAYR